MTGVGAPSDDAPVAPAEADVLLGDLACAPRLLLAVSGGPDSLALMHLAAQWRRDGIARGEPRPDLHVAVVDHQLRPDAAAEAQMVRARAAALSLPCATLVWDEPKPATGVAAAARQARYRLLFDHARAIACRHVLTAHHADDQAETILMRLCAGSGPSGLTGMRRESARDGLLLVRPLLGLPKSRLIASCQAAGLTWAEDPGNRDPAKARGKLRQLAGELEALGLGRERLLRLGERAARAGDALEHATTAAMAGAGAQASAGWFRLDVGAFAQRPPEFLIRALGRLLAQARGDARPQRLERIEAAAARLAAATRRGERARLSLGGMVLSLNAAGVCEARPEPPRRRGRGHGDRGRPPGAARADS